MIHQVNQQHIYEGGNLMIIRDNRFELELEIQEQKVNIVSIANEEVVNAFIFGIYERLSTSINPFWNYDTFFILDNEMQSLDKKDIHFIESSLDYTYHYLKSTSSKVIHKYLEQQVVMNPKLKLTFEEIKDNIIKAFDTLSEEQKLSFDVVYDIDDIDIFKMLALIKFQPFDSYDDLFNIVDMRKLDLELELELYASKKPLFVFINYPEVGMGNKQYSEYIQFLTKHHITVVVLTESFEQLSDVYSDVSFQIVDELKEVLSLEEILKELDDDEYAVETALHIAKLRQTGVCENIIQRISKRYTKF